MNSFFAEKCSKKLLACSVRFGGAGHANAQSMSVVPVRTRHADGGHHQRKGGTDAHAQLFLHDRLYFSSEPKSSRITPPQ